MSNIALLLYRTLFVINIYKYIRPPSIFVPLISLCWLVLAVQSLSISCSAFPRQSWHRDAVLRHRTKNPFTGSRESEVPGKNLPVSLAYDMYAKDVCSRNFYSLPCSVTFHAVINLIRYPYFVEGLAVSLELILLHVHKLQQGAIDQRFPRRCVRNVVSDQS